jgi:hypothetical protein
VVFGKLLKLEAETCGMAKQVGNILLTGTLDGLTFYKMEGQYYVRLKSSLTGKRVKKDPAFKQTMAYAERLAIGSRTASELYRQLPKEEQEVSLYRKMTSTAMQLLKTGTPAVMLMEALTAAFASLFSVKKVREVEPLVEKRILPVSIVLLPVREGRISILDHKAMKREMYWPPPEKVGCSIQLIA